MRTVTSALIGALTVGFVCFHAQAFPSKVGCDLLGESKMNVMERSTIMGEKVQNVDMIKRKQLQLSSDGTGVTITLTINFQMVESDTVGAVIHTSFGKLTGLPNQFISRDCTEFNSSVHYASAGSKLGLNMEVFLEAPTDSPPIYVSVLAAKGYGKVYRELEMVYVGADDKTPLFLPSGTKASTTTTAATKEALASLFPNSFETTSAASVEPFHLQD